MKDIKDLLKSIKIKPQNIDLYIQAMTHPSFANETRKKSNQRMEFFGDALLEKSATEFIYFHMPDLDEGEMTNIRSASVSGNSLAEYAKKIKLQDYILFGNKADVLKENDRVLEDAFEALVAAIYIDKGQRELEKFLSDNVFLFIKSSIGKQLKNPKTVLQEYLQLESRGLITYEAKEKGNQFEVKVYHDGHVYGVGIGKSKKDAEIAAAEDALRILKI